MGFFSFFFNKKKCGRWCKKIIEKKIVAFCVQSRIGPEGQIINKIDEQEPDENLLSATTDGCNCSTKKNEEKEEDEQKHDQIASVKCTSSSSLFSLNSSKKKMMVSYFIEYRKIPHCLFVIFYNKDNYRIPVKCNFMIYFIYIYICIE